MTFEQGVQAQKSGKPAEAEAIYRQIVEKDARNFDALHMLGIVCSEQEKFDEAERFFQQAGAIDQKFPPFFHNFGLHYSKKKEYAKAIAQFDRALQLFPNYPPVHSDRGCALAELDRLQEALTSHNKAVAMAPNVPRAFFNRALTFTKLGDHPAAIRDYDEALKSAPGYLDCWVGRGNALLKLKRYDEAIAAFEKAIALKPDLPEAWSGQADALFERKRYDEALNAYEKAPALKPAFADAAFCASFIRLLFGDIERGFKEHEARWDTHQYAGAKRDFAQPVWLGDGDIAGKTILLHAEQGIGDTIMMSRYAPMVAALGAKVVLEVQPVLMSLVQNLEGVSQVVAKGGPLPDFDLHCAVMSLPLAFKTRMETIPAKTPYLNVPDEALARWRKRLHSDGLKIGLGWAGNPNFGKDHDRSILLKNILPVCAAEGVSFFSIQKDLRDGDRELLKANQKIVHLGDEIEDFRDTAAIMSSLDLIISSDTSIVHVAGAMGKPIWILLPSNPDWRWLLERNDSPWYPTARLFRQKSDGDWRSVTDEVSAELQKLVASRGR